MRRGFSNIAAMLSALLALAAVHQNYAQNALRVSFIFPTASAPNPFKLAPGDLGHLDAEHATTGLAKSVAEGSGGERCEMSPEECAKFYPPLIDWIRNTLTASAPASLASGCRLRLVFWSHRCKESV